jgi:hypothetical protein
VAEIYRKTSNLRAVHFLLDYSRVNGTVRHLRGELEDLLSIAERIDICDILTNGWSRTSIRSGLDRLIRLTAALSEFLPLLPGFKMTANQNSLIE